MAVINTTIDDVFKATSVGTIDSAIGSNFYGINHRQTPSAIPINKDLNGLTLFTRPQLNLSTVNIRAERMLLPLLNKQPASIQRIIRCLLDPRLNINGVVYEDGTRDSISTPFVDARNPFIPILTNHLVSMSGWPDHTLESHISKPGAYKEVFGHVDSNIDKYLQYDLTATFRNMQGDPITKLFQYWEIYQSNVMQGIMSPYTDFIVNNEIDYNTRIYRLVLDKNKRYVQDIAACGASWPATVPLGTKFNFESEKPMNDTNSQITINFKCVGSCYNDDILIHEFNKVVEIFNPDMKESNLSKMVRIPDNDAPFGLSIKNLFNNAGYPRIDPYTYELEWYVSPSVYNSIAGPFNRHLDAITPTNRQPISDPTVPLNYI